MSNVAFKFIQRLLTPVPVNAPIAAGDRVDEALNKLQGQIDAGGGGGAAVSNAAPQPLGATAAAGTSADASRADHVHAKNVRAFTASGEVAATIKIWAGTVTSDGNGDFTVNYSSAGFTAPPMVTVSALSTNTDTVRDKEWATLRQTPTATSANGYTLRGNLIIAILIGGAETVRDAGNVAVHVQAIGV